MGLGTTLHSILCILHIFGTPNRLRHGKAEGCQDAVLDIPDSPDGSWSLSWTWLVSPDTGSGPQIVPVFIGLLLGPSDNASLHPSFSCLVQKGGTEQQEEAKNSNLSDELLPLLASQRGSRQDSSGLHASPVFCAAFQFTSIPRSNKAQLS